MEIGRKLGRTYGDGNSNSLWPVLNMPRSPISRWRLSCWGIRSSIRPVLLHPFLVHSMEGERWMLLRRTWLRLLTLC